MGEGNSQKGESVARLCGRPCTVACRVLLLSAAWRHPLEVDRFESIVSESGSFRRADRLPLFTVAAVAADAHTSLPVARLRCPGPRLADRLRRTLGPPEMLFAPALLCTASALLYLKATPEEGNGPDFSGVASLAYLLGPL